MNLWIGVSVAVAVMAAVWFASIYNRLVSLNNHCDNCVAQIQVQLKRRSDLIPGLVECVRGYMNHERETLERVLAARAQAVQSLRQALQQPVDTQARETWLHAESNLGLALSGMWVAMENYPDLKASQSVADLTEQLISTENRIAFARQAYNDWVTAFNSYRQTFPQCAVAGVSGFTQDRPLLEFDSAERLAVAPSVSAVS
jgi:LemA protein